MANILIVDDDEIFCTQLSLYIKRIGLACETAGNLHKGLMRAQREDFDIVFLDVFLPDDSGLNGIAEFKQTPSQPEVIIITGQGDPEGAEVAIKNGAWYYLEKPASFHTISLLVNRALEYRGKKFQSSKLKILNREFVIGNNAKIKNCLEVVAKAAYSEGNVLITGETGTGKELFARAIHLNSQRAKKQFITVDCTNIPVNLAESLLFGHTKGAFTGADQNREGLIVQADGGTLHIDEVGDLPHTVQKSFLRVLQDKKFRPLGAKKEVSSDFRVVSSTNRDLKQMVREGQFREDLYFRLVAFHVHLPPLRERIDDIKLLVSHYINKICEDTGVNTKGVSKDFLDFLMHYKWPGNVRELINILHTTIANATNEPVLYPHHLPMDLKINFFKSKASKKQKQGNKSSQITFEIRELVNFRTFPQFKKFRELITNMIESKYMDELVERSGGNVSEAGRLSAVSRARLYQLLKKHNKSLKD